MNENEFIEKCEQLLTRHGKRGAAIIGAFPHRDALVYRSPGLVILRGKAGDLEIAVRYYYLNKHGDERTMENPVFCRDAAGELYRTHGEYVYAIIRLQRLLAGEMPETPIRLGTDAEGRTIGLD